MRAIRLLVCTPGEMSQIDLLFRDALEWDGFLEAKVLQTPTGAIYFKRVSS